MNAIALLKSQHNEVAALFEQYETTEEPAAKQTIFNRIADNLAAHCTIEEELFYPSVYVGEIQKDLNEAVEEHLAAKRLIADLLSMSPEDVNYDAKVKVLSEQIEHHVEEEQNDLFPEVRKLLSVRELDALGDMMGQMFKDLMKESPRKTVPSQTQFAAPLV